MFLSVVFIAVVASVNVVTFQIVELCVLVSHRFERASVK